jgi:hypothetical protein
VSQGRPALTGIAALAALPAIATAQPDNPIDGRVRASAEAAQAYQGSLDGAWILTDQAGKPIYDFQLVERASGRGALEGVFRDLRRPPVAGDDGFIDSLERTGALLSLGFRARGAPVKLSLKGAADGAWTGELREDGAVTAVRMRRGLDF